ncbi:NADPH-dependent F420 reductase [Kineococcus arenarius]|uniref:NADPH-dependent F420 reductase n=1 Tax=Kineococcus sp. SYSU DK007 TaxID=3383128 RepID=UPI003D7CB441
MKIGILGVGNIGATLTRRLSEAGHHVQVANSRGPQTIDSDVLSTGAQAVEAADVVTDVDVVIISIPLAKIPDVAHLIAGVPPGTVVIDTSNYYPLRDGHIEALDGGQVESLWVSEQLGRPVVKAWNAITSQSFDAYAAPAGTTGRLAIPVAADDDADRALGMALVEETGFDAVDAGGLAESWRQQPGAPVYCTDLSAAEVLAALAAAVVTRSPRRHDLAMAVIAELTADPTADLGEDFLVRVNRLMYR